MNRSTLRISACILLTMLVPLAAAQKHRDPLTQPEIDKIRDASWEPQHRLTL